MGRPAPHPNSGNPISGRPLRRAVSAGAGPPTRLLIEGVESVQAVQDPSHQVTLVAGKRTIVRVYLGAEASAAINVRGELQVTGSAGSAPAVVSSINQVSVDPASNGQIQPKRQSSDKSLNFLLPETLTVAGSASVNVKALRDAETGEPIEMSSSPGVQIAFQPGAPLRLRLVGLRYHEGNPAVTRVPSDRDVALILSWLARAYPVPRVEATYVVVDANRTWPFTASQVNAQLAAMRSLDVAGGVDPRTHYYGVVEDKGGANFMRGRASGIPASPDPSVVASGPTGAGTFGWDFDGSYGDWYAAHELAHTFGRFHPGFCAGNSADDPSFPFPNGQLSGSQPAFVGFDVGDADHGIPLAALPGNTWHDVMTYCDNQWMSAYTFEGIRQRLLEEDALVADAGAVPAPGAPAASRRTRMTLQRGSFINVVAVINFANRTGSIEFVHPVDMAAAPATADGPSALLRLRDAGATLLAEHTVAVSRESCQDAGQPPMGLINAVVPAIAAAASIELVFEGQVVDRFQAGPAPSPVSNVRRAGTVAGLPALAWDSPEAADPRITYTVQIRPDPADAWQTVAIGRRTPDAQIDRQQFPGQHRLFVRVLATNGLRSTQVSEAEIDLE